MVEVSSSSRKTRFGFKLGSFFAITGCVLRVAAPLLSWNPIGDGVWSKNEALEQSLVEISLAAIAFGLVSVTVTLNRWLWDDRT